MASSIALRFIAFVAFATLVGGSTYGAYQTLQPDDLAPRGVAVSTAESTLAVAPGSTFSIGVGVRNPGQTAEDVRVLVRDAEGFTSGEPALATVPAQNATGAFVPVTAPADAAPGTVTLTVVVETVKAPVKRATTTVTVTVLGDDPHVIAEGDGAVVQYVGRLAADGALFDTNLPAYANLSFPRTDYFRASARDATVYTDANANLITGFREALIGMREGEWRTIRLAAEDAYGPNDLVDEIPRTQDVDRTETLPIREVSVSLDEFEALVTGSGKAASEYESGDHFTTTVRDDTYRFRVTDRSEEGVEYILDPEIGDRFTMPDRAYWPKAAVVTAANDTAVEFTIEPTTDVGEAFTFHAYWPGGSAIREMTDSTIVIEHSPSVGSTFERSPRSGGDPVTHTVVAVEDDVIRVSYESPHPLAGEDIVFDVRIVEVLAPRGT